ncbi:HK97 family phage prohead protease [Rhodovarius lipocyclicus]|uniref:HK97 family phage prohead protease n=1 Tax=Rhodovarius lipocyclicus TaxID=268410 RepID=UPI00135CDA6E|nr:HK97 family phage prohead protease [Rhodovarius lipocyclicus]
MVPARFPNGTERRFATEYRAAGRKLEGYAAVFGEAARIGGFSEVIQPGAFSRSLAAATDILALVDHDPGRLLGRTSSGTLRLAADSRGLTFSLDVPDTALGRDMLALAERRDLGGMSFSFIAKRDLWPSADKRELVDVDLLEVSIVQAHPAYAGTSVAARSAGQAGAAWRRRLVEVLA